MKTIKIIILIICTITNFSCEKEFLAKKPNKALLVPSTLDDFQALLDNSSDMNQGPYLTVIGADEFYATDASLISATATIRNSYLWNKEVFDGAASNDWSKPYEQVFYSNIVLDGLEQMKDKDGLRYQQIKGAALFYRAYAMFNLVQEFAPVYSKENSKLNGLIIYRNSNVNERPGRSSVGDTYDFIINDLLQALPIVPVQTAYKSRPIRTTVNAMLSRVYLTMSNFVAAEHYADICLKENGKLIDYNDFPVNPSSALRVFPTALPNGNDEILFFSQMISTSFLTSATTTIIDPDLYNSYDDNDLRKAHFFVNRGAGVVNFKGSYAGSGLLTLFCGLAIDEIYLIRAECRARRGAGIEALADINFLLMHRWKRNKFVEIIHLDNATLLKFILLERKKELVFRGLRWSDLKRLNLEQEYQVELKRSFAGKVYSLSSNDIRYVYPIPDKEIIGSNIEQNER